MSEDKKEQFYSDIFMDGDSLDRDLLKSLTAPNAKIYRNAGRYEIAFTDIGNDLTVRQKLLVFLLARKILWDTEIIEVEGMTPSELESETHIAGGTIRPILGKLMDARLVQKDDEGRYFVPNYSLNKIREELEKK